MRFFLRLTISEAGPVRAEGVVPTRLTVRGVRDDRRASWVWGEVLVV